MFKASFSERWKHEHPGHLWGVIQKHSASHSPRKEVRGHIRKLGGQNTDWEQWELLIISECSFDNDLQCTRRPPGTWMHSEVATEGQGVLRSMWYGRCKDTDSWSLPGVLQGPVGKGDCRWALTSLAYTQAREQEWNKQRAITLALGQMRMASGRAVIFEQNSEGKIDMTTVRCWMYHHDSLDPVGEPSVTPSQNCHCRDQQ